MAATEAPEKVEALFTKLESRQSILSSCTSLYKTLISHFSSLEHSIASQSQTLDSKLLTLDSDFHNSLQKLHLREQSIPTPFSSEIETLTQLALEEIGKPEPVKPSSIADELKSLCMKMDAHRLLKMIMSKKKEAAAVKSSIESALAECVDPVRLVLDSVAEFMELKAIAAKNGQPDRRWACGVVVGGLFPPEKLKERKEEDVGALFPRSVFQRANEMAKEWKEKAEASGLATGSGFPKNEASIFLQFVAGFGLKDTFGYEFIKSLMLETSLRKDMAKFSLPLFGKKRVEDIVNELLESEKDVDAVYFVKEGNLTEKFNPASILKAYLSKAENDAKDALRKGNNSFEAADEANHIERTALKHIIKCVEDNKLEDEFPLTIPKKRMSNLERITDEKKSAASGGGGRPSSHKRGHSSSGPPPSHPAKVSRFTGSYQQPYRQRNPVSPAHQNPVSRYPTPHNIYPSQSAYDTGVPVAPYGSTTYGGSHLPSLAQAVSQPPPYGSTSYGGSHLPNLAQAVSQAPPYAYGENLNVRAPTPRAGESYGGSYSLYDYASGSLNTYRPPYAQ